MARIGVRRTRVAAAVILAGMGGVGPASAQSDAAPEPAVVSAEAFRGLGWLEGRWVGSGGGYDAFYEAYRFVNDSTLEQTTYPDDGFTDPDGRSTMEFRDGRVLKHRDGRAESAVVRLAGDTIRFQRLPPGRSGFTWIREDADTWTAVLDRPGGDPVVYTLRRIPGG